MFKNCEEYVLKRLEELEKENAKLKESLEKSKNNFFNELIKDFDHGLNSIDYALSYSYSNPDKKDINIYISANSSVYQELEEYLEKNKK